MKALAKKKKIWAGKRDDVVFYAVMAFLPLAQFFLMYICVNFNSLLMAFQDTNSAQSGGFTFDNIQNAFSFLISAEVLRLEGNSVLMMLLVAGIGTVLGLIFSFYIYKQYALGNAFKVILYLPTIISAVVMGIIYTNFVGFAIPAYVEGLFGTEIPSLLDAKDPTTVFWAVIFFNIWIGFGSSVLLYSNSMSGISQEIVESSHLDGASGLQEFWYISLPHVYPVMTTFIITNIAGIFTNQFQVYTLIPSTKADSVKTLGLYLFTETLDLSKSPSVVKYADLSAIGVLLTCVCVPLTFAVRWLMEKFGPSEE